MLFLMGFICEKGRETHSPGHFILLYSPAFNNDAYCLPLTLRLTIGINHHFKPHPAVPWPHRSTYPGVSTYIAPETGPERGPTGEFPAVEKRPKVSVSSKTALEFLQWGSALVRKGALVYTVRGHWHSISVSKKRRELVP